jgi:tetratricopeptide (TPR) repeat protein
LIGTEILPVMLNKHIKILFSLLIYSFITAIFSGVSFASEDNVIYEQCYLSRVKDAKIGYSCIIQKETTDKDKKYIITNRHSEQEFNRFGSTVKLVQDFEYTEDAYGNPKSLNAHIKSIGEDIFTEALFYPENKIIINSTVNSVKKTREITTDKKILFPYAVYKQFKENLNKSGIEYSTLDPIADMRVITINAIRMGSEFLSEYNLNQDYTKYRVTIDLLPNIGNYEWYTSDGRLVKEYSSILDIEQIAVPKEKIHEKSASADISKHSIIPVNTVINFPFSIEQITYKISTKNINPEKLFVNNERQRIIQVKDNTAYIKVKNEQYSGLKIKSELQREDFKKYLQPGVFINSYNKDIKTAAAVIAKDKKNRYETAKAMEKWVYENIKSKDFSVNFANSSEVLKSLRGDCTEHSVLLAALLRAQGIPSKIVVGLIYKEKPESTFVYHMWVKAFTDKWINLDPCFPEKSFSPIHLEITESAFNDMQDRTNVFLKVLTGISNISIEILNYSAISNPVAKIKLSGEKQANINEFNILSLLKNNDDFIKKTNIKGDNEITKIEIKKDQKEEYIKSGYYYYSCGNINSAVDSFTEASKLIGFNNDFEEILFTRKLASLGLFNLANKKLSGIYDMTIWEKQIKSIKRLYFPKILPDAEKEMLLAKIASNIEFNGNINEAINLLEDKKLYNFDYANYLRAKAYNKKGDFDKAESALNRALEINPENLKYRFELATILTDSKKYKEANDEILFILNQQVFDKEFHESVKLEQYRLKSLSEKKKEDRDYYLARYFALKGDFNNAKKIINSAVNGITKYSKLYSLLGDINYHLNEFDEAYKNYSLAAKYDKKDDYPLAGLASVKLSGGDYKGSLKLFLNALSKNEKSEEILLNIAAVNKLLSQEEVSLKYYNKVLYINPYNYKANYELACMYMNLGESEKASVFLKKSLSVNPLFAPAWLEMAKIQIDIKNNYLANTYLIPVNFIDSNNPDYYYLSGLIYKNDENYSKAASSFKKTLELDKNHSPALKELKSLEIKE